MMRLRVLLRSKLFHWPPPRPAGKKPPVRKPGGFFIVGKHQIGQHIVTAGVANNIE
jgi:hypothetical protein